MEIIEHSHHEWHEQFSLSFRHEGWGYSFDCDHEGNIIKIGPYARLSLATAIQGYCDGYYEMRIEDYSCNQFVPMTIRCTESVRTVVAKRTGNNRPKVIEESYDECGEELWLWGDEQCPNCGQWYNSFGQRLRDNWMDNPSNWDDSIGDMEGYELAELRRERELEWMDQL